MMKKIVYILIGGLLCVLSACQKQSEWGQEERWYRSVDGCASEHSGKCTMHDADLFYIVSTEVIASTDDAGQEVYNAVLTQAEKEMLQQEMDFIAAQLGDSLNMYAPYYHQFTMNAILLPRDSFQMAFDKAQEEVKQAFEYYIHHYNTDRPFVIVGFSQGAMMIPALLTAMSDETYNRCKGAYMMGYRLTCEDLQNPRLTPARGEKDGKVISFNSVSSADKQWPFISGDAATCINPLNWTTDATPATLFYQQDTITIVQDTVSHLLLCNVDSERYYLPGTEPWYEHGCLHHWDILFYNDALHKNILKRVRK